MNEQPRPDCADFIERIVYFLDNELDEADVHAVRHHLDECGPCLRKYDLERTLKQIVARSCHERAPESLREKVLFQLREIKIHITEL